MTLSGTSIIYFGKGLANFTYNSAHMLAYMGFQQLSFLKIENPIIRVTIKELKKVAILSELVPIFKYLSFGSIAGNVAVMVSEEIDLLIRHPEEVNTPSRQEPIVAKFICKGASSVISSNHFSKVIFYPICNLYADLYKEENKSSSEKVQDVSSDFISAVVREYSLSVAPDAKWPHLIMAGIKVLGEVVKLSPMATKVSDKVVEGYNSIAAVAYEVIESFKEKTVISCSISFYDSSSRNCVDRMSNYSQGTVPYDVLLPSSGSDVVCKTIYITSNADSDNSLMGATSSIDGDQKFVDE